ncbi:PIN domain-containing protein [Nocardia carnea]|uniref:PIN domain-containing protein n=1 Tax=Nocardia carnea TaxID=37328 RepID=UPI002457346C|nr:PIN domain-containing protein [Nocardia carnea]
MPAQRPVLVFDTNMVHTDRDLNSAYWQGLAEAVAAGEVEVVFPEVVVRETGRHIHQDEKAARKNVQNAVRAVLESLEASGLATDWPALSTLPTVKELRSTTPPDDEGARKRFRARLSDLGFKVAPIPEDVSHDLLVDWSLRSHPPFDSTDKGYRDALIWHTVLAVAETDPQRCVVFVSNDNDCLTKGEATPKDEILAQLTDRKLEAVEFTRSIDDALTAAQAARAAEAAAESLPVAEVWGLVYPAARDKLDGLVGASLEGRDSDWALVMDSIALVPGLESPTVSGIYFPGQLFANSRTGYSGRVLIGTVRTFPIDVEYEALLHKSDFYALLSDDDIERITVLDPDWGDHVSQVGGAFCVEAEFSFSIDPVEKRVLAVELVGLRAAKDAVNRLSDDEPGNLAD